MITERIIENKTDESFQQSMSSEKPVRSVVKAMSWRVVGTLDTMAVSYIITGSVATAFQISSIDFITKMILYFFHERAWNAIKWGRK